MYWPEFDEDLSTEGMFRGRQRLASRIWTPPASSNGGCTGDFA
ncbi:hypothetical protein ACN2MM_00630 [Alkalilimnicola ehrlichii MLHE-1]